MTIKILLTTPATDAGPFNIYSNVDGFVSAVATNVSKATLSGGYVVNVPDGTTTVRLVSIGECTNYIDFSIFPPCSTDNVYLIMGNGDLFSYNPDTEDYQYLSTVDDGPDVAMTNDKMFVIDFDRVLWEYDITLSPWSITLNRTIDLSALIPFGAGLEALSNTKLLWGGFYVYEIDISGVTPSVVQLFELPGNVAGDIYYNPFANTIYVTYATGFFGPHYIGEYSYGGQLINSALLPTGKFPYGMYAYNSTLYVINSDGSIYEVDDVTLATTLADQISAPNQVYGAAQPPSCRNNVVPPYTTTTTTTIYVDPFSWYYGTFSAPGGVVPIPDENDIDISTGTLVTSVDPSGPIIVPFNSANDDFLWFAIPVTAGTKSNWYVDTLNQGLIGGPANQFGNLFPDPITITYNTVSMYLYISTARTDVVQMTIS